MKRILFALISTLISLCSYATDLVAQADSAYTSEDYRTAAKLYTRAIEEDGASATVLYNLGNTYFRMGSIGKSILNYERALKLNPSFKDARTNLEFVKTLIVDKPEDDSSFLGNLYESIIASASPDAWSWIALTAFLCLLGCVALYIFTSHVALRKAGFFGGIVMVFITIFLLTVAYNASSRINRHDRAIVMVPTTNLTSAPRSPKTKTEKVVPVHEGTVLRIVDSVATPDDVASHMYYDVKINNTTRAWVKATDVERI